MDQANLNMRLHRWFDVVKDYHCEILYHPSKANVVVDKLSRKKISAPIKDPCLRMTVITPILEMIKRSRMRQSRSRIVNVRES